MKLVEAKLNLSPPAELARWFRKESVLLPNGDEVGVVSVDHSVRQAQLDKRQQLAGILGQHIGVGESKLVARCADFIEKEHPQLFGGIKAQAIQRSYLPKLLMGGVEVGVYRVEYVNERRHGGTHWVDVRARVSEFDKVGMYSEVDGDTTPALSTA